MMESKVAEAISKKETLKARALSAETTKQLNESIVSMVCLVFFTQLCIVACPSFLLVLCLGSFDYMLLHLAFLGLL